MTALCFLFAVCALNRPHSVLGAMLWARNPHTWVRGEYSTQRRHPLASSASTNEHHTHRIRHVTYALSGPGPRGGSDLTINDSLDAMEGKIDEESVVWRLQDLRQREEAIRLEREELELELLHVSQARALKRQERIFRERQEQAMKERSGNGAGEQPAGEATGKASAEAEGGSGGKRRRKRRGKGKKLGRMSAMASAAATQRKVEQLSQKSTAGSQNNGGSGAADTWQESSIATPGSSVHVLPFDPDDMCVLPKPIFLLSDCTGESAARTVKAALGQFEMYSKMSCQANLIIFRFLSDERKVYNVVQRVGELQAAEEEALIVYTLVDVTILRSVKTACRLYDVKALDLWGDLLDVMETHLQQARLGVPLARMNRSEQLPADYFRMIEAVEYTRKMDDGANPDQWKHADLLLLGVSRSGKTPLSIYLGQRGYKVANLPLVAGLPPPPQLFQIDQHKIVGLIIDSQLLAQVRAARMGTMGVEQSQFNYSDMNKIRSELDWAQEMYRQNPLWPVLDVTFRGVEETAARILRIMSDRYGDRHPLVAEGHTVLTG